uniref:Orphan Fox-1 n=1 Tax=Phallusia mammillata TaxID=59560 RepID=A0A6F9DD18_9ASCI|nr:Orphan Fox-1 [Phallusia mammillata]
MVLYTKTKLSSPMVSISRSGKVMSLEKWKTDWFHEISELFHVTTDQVAAQINTCKPTFEKVRAIESKARLNTVLSLIERYIRGQLLVTSSSTKRKPIALNANNSNNRSASTNWDHLDELKTSGVMPWTMVDPNEVCPVDHTYQARSPEICKSSYNLEEAVELLSGDYAMDDAASSIDLESSEDSSSLPSSDEKDAVASPPQRPKLLLMVNGTAPLSRKRKRTSEKEVDEFADDAQQENTPVQSSSVVSLKNSGKLTHLLIPVSRSQLGNESKLTHARQGLSKVLQGQSQKLPPANVLLKRIEIPASSIQRQKLLKGANLKVEKPITDLETKPSDFSNEIFPNGALSELTDNTIGDDMFSFLENEESPLTSADLRMTSAEMQMQSLSSLFSQARPTKLTDIQNKMNTINSQHLQFNVPPVKPKRKYTKHQKKADGSENQTVENEFSKPPLPYNQLIYLVFKQNNFCQLTVRNIYKCIRLWFPYYEHAHQTWQNAVRHQLCCCKDYEKITLSPDSVADKGGKCAWKIRDQVSLKKLDEDLLAHLDKNDVIFGIRNSMLDCDVFDSIFGDILNRHKNRKTVEQRIDEAILDM